MKPFALILLGIGLLQAAEPVYYPPPDANGGWRTPNNEAEVPRVTGLDPAKLRRLCPTGCASEEKGPDGQGDLVLQ